MTYMANPSELNNTRPVLKSGDAPVFDEGKGTVLLAVAEKVFDFAGIHETAEKEGFQKKDTFHITIVGFRNGSKVNEALGKLPQGDREKVIAQIRTLLYRTDWSFALGADRFRISKEYIRRDPENGDGQIREMRSAYVQMASLPALENFYKELNVILGTALEPPPAHITLYTKGDDPERSKMGIGIDSTEDFTRMNPELIQLGTSTSMKGVYNTILLPTRPQPDTIAGIFLLKVFGKSKYPGVENASVGVLSDLPKGETADSLAKKGNLLIDVGGSRFDHHNKKGTTASQLIAQDLGIDKNAALTKLLNYAERDDKYGRGTISQDPLDKAFGLSGLIAVLNKALPTEPEKVVNYVIPLLKAHYVEERKRTEDLPKEFEERIQNGTAEVVQARHKGKNIRFATLESDNPSMTGWLRSAEGVRADVVVQKTSAGHVNITTRPLKRIDLRWAAALLRKEEADRRNRSVNLSAADFMRTGRIEEVPEWYYDRATNSMLNGGIIPKGVEPTAIEFEMIKELVKEGLAVSSEKKTSPMPQS